MWTEWYHFVHYFSRFFILRHDLERECTVDHSILIIIHYDGTLTLEDGPAKIILGSRKISSYVKERAVFFPWTILSSGDFKGHSRSIHSPENLYVTKFDICMPNLVIANVPHLKYHQKGGILFTNIVRHPRCTRSVNCYCKCNIIKVK
jgi:hypothetical protein